MADWLLKFKYNPVKPLLESEDEAVIYFTKRDLLGEKVERIDKIWDLPEVHKILKNQHPDGSWKSRKKNKEII